MFPHPLNFALHRLGFLLHPGNPENLPSALASGRPQRPRPGLRQCPRCCSLLHLARLVPIPSLRLGSRYNLTPMMKLLSALVPWRRNVTHPLLPTIRRVRRPNPVQKLATSPLSPTTSTLSLASLKISSLRSHDYHLVVCVLRCTYQCEAA